MTMKKSSVQFVTIACNGNQFEIANEHKKYINDLVVISPFKIKNVESIDVPFANVTNQTDVFWRSIYATEKRTMIFVASNCGDVNYDLINKLAETQSNVFFVDNSLNFKNGYNFSCDFFRIDRNRNRFFYF